MARQSVDMVEHTCDHHSCAVARHVPSEMVAPPGWLTGTAARADEDGRTPHPGTMPDWEACSLRHVSGAIAAVVDLAEVPDSPVAGSAAEVADDPADATDASDEADEADETGGGPAPTTRQTATALAGRA